MFQQTRGDCVTGFCFVAKEKALPAWDSASYEEFTVAELKMLKLLG
jgi:hypothetical protein